MTKDLLIIGDSNVTRNYTRLGYQAQSVSVVQARNRAEVLEGLNSIKNTFKIVVFACLTNLIISSGEEGSSAPERLTAIAECLNGLLPLIW